MQDMGVQDGDMRMKTPVMKFGTRLMVAGALALTTPAAAAPVGGAIDPHGSTIVECVALAAALNTNPAQLSSNVGTASMPQNPLGPFACWPRDDQPIQ
jgi:hypothetical protein